MIIDHRETALETFLFVDLIRQCPGFLCRLSSRDTGPQDSLLLHMMIAIPGFFLLQSTYLSASLSIAPSSEACNQPPCGPSHHNSEPLEPSGIFDITKAEGPNVRGNSKWISKGLICGMNSIRRCTLIVMAVQRFVYYGALLPSHLHVAFHSLLAHGYGSNCGGDRRVFSYIVP